jgi:hypothetical protein
MSGIIWLASYPKSGNTWLRAFLANLFQNRPAPVDINALARFAYGDARGDFYERVAGRPFEDLSDDELHALRPQVHRLIAGQSPDMVFAKTHNAVKVLGDIPLITPEVTAGAIYVIRNPLDVTVSYAHHFALPIDHVIEAMASDINHVLSVGRNVFQFLGTWSDHVRSWTTAPGLTCQVVRYEDLSRDPKKSFGKVVKFLDLPREPKRLDKAIRFSAFDTLAGQEKESGFIEQSKHNEAFFRKGRVGDWRRVLSPEQVAKVIAHQGDVMADFGYLDKDGKARIWPARAGPGK